MLRIISHPGVRVGNLIEGEYVTKRMLSEDWIAVILGLALALLVGVGLVSKIPWPLFGWLR